MTTLWGISETAERLGVSKGTVRTLVHKHGLPCVRLHENAPLQFDPLDVDAFIESRKTGQRRQTIAPMRAAKG